MKQRITQEALLQDEFNKRGGEVMFISVAAGVTALSAYTGELRSMTKSPAFWGFIGGAGLISASIEGSIHFKRRRNVIVEPGELVAMNRPGGEDLLRSDGVYFHPGAGEATEFDEPVTKQGVLRRAFGVLMAQLDAADATMQDIPAETQARIWNEGKNDFLF